MYPHLKLISLCHDSTGRETTGQVEGVDSFVDRPGKTSLFCPPVPTNTNMRNVLNQLRTMTFVYNNSAYYLFYMTKARFDMYAFISLSYGPEIFNLKTVELRFKKMVCQQDTLIMFFPVDVTDVMN